MKNSKTNFNQIFNTKNFIKKPKLISVENLREITKMTSEQRKEHISTFCSEEDFNKLTKIGGNLDSTTLIQFALEDLNMSVDTLSDRTRINIQTLKQIINGRLMPWKLKVEEAVQLLHTLDISIDDYIDGLKSKTIVINTKDINIEGIQLPRAKNMTKKEQKKAMIQMEKQILIQDEVEARDQFIQTLKNFVNR